MERAPIRSFEDLEVYQLTFKASLVVAKEIVPKLPLNDLFGLRNQVGRSSCAVPRLIAEGYGKRHQRLGFHKYLDDANAESNETQVSLCHIKEIYGHLFDLKLLEDLIKTYDRASRQIYNLSKAWNQHSRPPHLSLPIQPPPPVPLTH